MESVGAEARICRSPGAGRVVRSTPLTRPGRASRAGAALAWAVLATCAGGCVGYVMGWSDAEVERLRRVVAELEAKNVSLVEEVIELRRAAGGRAGGAGPGPESAEESGGELRPAAADGDAPATPFPEPAAR